MASSGSDIGTIAAIVETSSVGSVGKILAILCDVILHFLFQRQLLELQ